MGRSSLFEDWKAPSLSKVRLGKPRDQFANIANSHLPFYGWFDFL